MPYTNPTAAEFKTFNPRFVGVGDAVINRALAGAGRKVDTAWAEDDYQPGYMLYAAHLLVLDGFGEGVEAKVNAAGAGDVKTFRSASLTVDRFDPASGSEAGTLGSTSYGRRFMELQAKYGGALVATTGGDAGYHHLARDWPFAVGGWLYR